LWLAWGLGTFEDLDRRLPGEDGRNSDGAKGHTITHAAYLQIEKKTIEYIILSSAIKSLMLFVYNMIVLYPPVPMVLWCSKLIWLLNSCSSFAELVAAFVR